MKKRMGRKRVSHAFLIATMVSCMAASSAYAEGQGGAGYAPGVAAGGTEGVIAVPPGGFAPEGKSDLRHVDGASGVIGGNHAGNPGPVGPGGVLLDKDGKPLPHGGPDGHRPPPLPPEAPGMNSAPPMGGNLGGPPAGDAGGPLPGNRMGGNEGPAPGGLGINPAGSGPDGKQ